MKHIKLNTNTGMTYPCDICNATKATCNTSKKRFRIEQRHLYELIDSDICEMPITSVDGFKYFALFVDDCHIYIRVSLIRKKSEIYKSFMNLIENGSFCISAIKSGQGSEF